MNREGSMYGLLYRPRNVFKKLNGGLYISWDPNKHK